MNTATMDWRVEDQLIEFVRIDGVLTTVMLIITEHARKDKRGYDMPDFFYEEFHDSQLFKRKKFTGEDAPHAARRLFDDRLARIRANDF